MSFGSSFDTKEQVRQATDLVDLVSRSFQLRRQGRIYVGLCPWHDDSRPSLQVNPDRQTWKCWVCDLGGDVFSFVMKREGVDFPEAMRILADRAGIELSPQGSKKATPGSPDDKQTLYRVMAWAEEQYQRCLLDSPEAELARQYLIQRGISQDSILGFHLGFSPPGWQWLLDRARTTSFAPAVLDAAGLLSKTQDGQRFVDRFRNRLIFSIRDTEHRPIAFGGRILPQQAGNKEAAKYINSPETRLFSKSNHLYGLDIVRAATKSESHIIVVEGYTDVIMAHQQGLNNVVAALGTAVGERHVGILRRFADQITLVLDGDEAGQRRTNEVLELFVAAQVDLRVLTLPSGLDPCDFLRDHGRAAFDELLLQAVDALDHKVRTVTEGLNVTQDVDQAHRALDDILRTMANAPRLAAVANESLRLREQQMLVRLARQFHVEESLLRARLLELHQQARRPKAASAATERSVGLTPPEQELFEILLSHPELVEQALETVEVAQLTSPRAREVWELYLCAQREGISYESRELLTLAESLELKSLLEQLYDQACRKASLASIDAELRLHGIVRDYHFQKQRFAQRRTLATLENREYDEQEELAVLQKMIEQERNRQGISAPTDG
ncbi:MAG: DNA primase [Pirellulaceae bacterium]